MLNVEVIFKTAVVTCLFLIACDVVRIRVVLEEIAKDGAES